jgi:hypothetical protein
MVNTAVVALFFCLVVVVMMKKEERLASVHYRPILFNKYSILLLYTYTYKHI